MIKTLSLAILMTAALTCPDEPFCGECDNTPFPEKQCVRCDFAFLDPSNKNCTQVIQDKVAHCVEYFYDSYRRLAVCKKCEEGFTVTNDNRCFRCGLDGCAICDENDNCKACFNNMLPENNTCNRQKKCDIPNCEICSAAEYGNRPVCYSCSQGFALNNSKRCDVAIPNCRQLRNNDPNICQSCVRGFFVTSNNTCEANPEHDGHSTIWFWFLLLLIVLFGGAFYYYRVYRQGPKRNEYREDYVSINNS